MDKKFLSVSILICSVIISGAVIGSAMAQGQQSPLDSIQYPVKELGNCQSKQACKAYCDDSKNIDACLSFAEKNNLMSAKELAMARKFKEIGMIGPGGCDGKDSCDKYCSESGHMEECITFAQQNGLMSGKELEESQKVLAAIKKGVKPPACNGKKECDNYCSSSDHMEECMNFSIEAGLMPPEEQENAQKMLSAIKRGIKPPACRGEEECQNYCSQDAHIEECIKFGEATGMMKKEDADRMRRTGGKGPGDCKSKTECEAFCNTPENQETCMNFAKDNGMMSQKDLQKMEQGKQQMKQAFTNMPPQVSECLSSAFGVEMAEKIKSGSVMPSQEIGEKMRTCFEGFKPKQSEGMTPGQGGTMQPGQERENFGPTQAMPQQIQGGPGGCQGAEECKSYCETHQEECQKFQSPPMRPGTQNMQPGTQGLEGQQIEKQYQQYQQQMTPAGSAPGTSPGMAPQNQPGQFIQTQQGGQYQQQPMMPQGEQAPMQQIQPQQPMMQSGTENIAPPPPSESAPQPEPAPATMNSNNLFGTIIKPFTKIFGL